MAPVRHHRTEDELREWLTTPFVDFAQHCDLLRARGHEVNFDPNLIDTFGPKGAIVPSLAGVVLLVDSEITGVAFAEVSLPSPQGSCASFIQEIWLVKSSDERRWFEFLADELGSDPIAKDEPTVPPIRSWFWVVGRDGPVDCVRLTKYPDGGVKISKIAPRKNSEQT